MCIRDSHEAVRVLVKDGLSASAARRKDPSALVTDRDDRGQRPGTRRGRHAENNELRTGATGEVIHVDAAVDAPGGVHRRRGDGVVRVLSLIHISEPTRPY